MDIIVRRGVGKDSGKPYFKLLAVNEVGEVGISFDKGVISQLLPYGYTLASLPMGDTKIGEIREEK